MFIYEEDVAGQDSLHNSDVMISDWSGAALDYAFGLNKPVIFVDVPRKVNNPDYKELDIEPFEAQIREKIGTIVSSNKFSLDKITPKIPDLTDKYYYEISPNSFVEILNTIIDSEKTGDL